MGKRKNLLMLPLALLCFTTGIFKVNAETQNITNQDELKQCLKTSNSTCIIQNDILEIDNFDGAGSGALTCFNVTNNVIVDLNGHKLTSKESLRLDRFFSINGKNVVFKDSVGTGEVINQFETFGNVFDVFNGSLSIYGGTYTSKSSTLYTYFENQENKVQLYGGTFKSTSNNKIEVNMSKVNTINAQDFLAPGYKFVDSNNNVIVQYSSGDRSYIRGDIIKVISERTNNIFYTVKYDSDGRNGIMYNKEVDLNNNIITLAQNTFSSNSYEHFIGWEVNGEKKQPGDRITVTGDLTIKALWEDDEYNYKADKNEKDYSLKSGKDVSFKINAIPNIFETIYFFEDNNTPVELDRKYYTVNNDGTLITIKSEFLDNLDIKEHGFVISYNTGNENYASFFKINVLNQNLLAEPNPETLDNMLIYFAMSLISLLAIVSTLLYLKKEN